MPVTAILQKRPQFTAAAKAAMTFTPRVTVLLAMFGTSFGAKVAVAGPVTVKVPMVCTRGPDDTAFNATATMPASAAIGSTFTVRIDSHPSGVINHFGLNYIYGMTTDYQVPAGTRYVEGSARVVPGTGSANALPGARATHESSRIRMVLPAHIANGSSYTPPSLEFDVKVDAPVETRSALSFLHYEVVANAAIVGDVHTSCDPVRKPYHLAMVRFEPREAADRREAGGPREGQPSGPMPENP
jgi:hypothetical protein